MMVESLESFTHGYERDDVNQLFLGAQIATLSSQRLTASFRYLNAQRERERKYCNGQGATCMPGNRFRMNSPANETISESRLEC